MDQAQSIAIKEWVTDIDEKSLSAAQAFYLKNREFFVNIHGGKINGQTIGKNTPLPANYEACQINFPAGENYSVGTYSSKRTNEIYVFVFNTNDVNFIYRLNASGCDIVYHACLPLNPEPKSAIPQWRAWLDVQQTCKNWAGKRLIWTDGDFIGCLDVEASIATNSFTTPYFDCDMPLVATPTIDPNIPGYVQIALSGEVFPGTSTIINIKRISDGHIFPIIYNAVIGDTLSNVINGLAALLANSGFVASYPTVSVTSIYTYLKPEYEFVEVKVINVPSNNQCCSDPCDFAKLCVPTPLGCLSASFLSKSDADKLLANKMVDIGFQFMYRWVYYDGRKSTWSDPSSYFFQSSKECFENPDGFARCMKLRIPIGNAMVAYIEFAYRNNNVNQWYLVERIAKYKQYNNAQQQWYDRQFSEIITSPSANYSSVDCSFDYVFCNDKQCEALDPTDTARVYNPFPRGAQCIIPFKESIAFINYKKGNCPLPKSVSNNMHITNDCSGAVMCDVEYATVTVRAIIHEFYHDRNQFIYVTGDDANTGTKTFGGLNDEFEGGFEDGAQWGQVFQGSTKNFIAYVEGAEQYFCEMKQWKHHNQDNTEVGPVTGMGSVHKRNDLRRFLNGNGFYYQEAIIKVPKGTKGFIRICSHSATTADTATSTYVLGITNLTTYNGHKNLGGVNTTNILKDEEIEFDTCNGDQNIWDRALVIRDNAQDTGFGSPCTAVSGYITDNSGSPLAGVIVGIEFSGFPGLVDLRSRTDHNGFYHCMSTQSGFNEDVNVVVIGELDCGSVFKEIGRAPTHLSSSAMASLDITVSNTTYVNNNYDKVIVNVTNCAGQPVGGIRIAMKGAKSLATLSSGQAIFKIRNYESRDRVVKAILMDRNGCFKFDCNNNCNPCLPSTGAATPACYIGTPSQTLPSLILNVDSADRNDMHLKYGGRYGFGGIAKGDCGNLSFVNKGLYIYIPKRCQGVNSNCKLKYDFSAITFPSWVKSFTIVRTANLNPFELQWVIDKAEYVDGKIKITIQSLNDYNFNHFFKTNTVYQYNDGDRLEFISDENGIFFCQSLNYQILSPFFDTAIHAKTDEPADYFNQILIEDDGRIGKILQSGIVIEMQRPKQCATDDIYYTVCAELKVENGLVVNPVGTFTTFDTYNINRKIGNNPAREFEHHSPSDFWGTRITDIGTAHVVNEFEDEKRYERNITISAADDFNRFGDLEKTIGDAQMGGIVAMSITDDKAILGICENDNFIAQTADDLLRVGANGVVQAATGDQAISNAQPKLSGKYGCQYDHIGSIYFGDGYATWADVNNHAFIMHDYSEAKDVSFGKISTWTSKRFQELQLWNSLQTDPLNKFRFSTGYNHLNQIVMLTLKQFRQSGIDNAWEPWISTNETISYRPADDKFYGQYSFTPEAYGSINLFNDKGAAFVTINHGEAWIHPVIPEKWGEFYGVPVDQVAGVCMNKYSDKQKKGLSIEIQDRELWFAYKINTDNPNFQSEIPIKRWKKSPNKSNAAFLSDINGRGGLYATQSNFAGGGTVGYFIKCIFVRDNTDQLQYNTIDNAKRILYDELDMILFKFMVKEQSGFTGNL